MKDNKYIDSFATLLILHCNIRIFKYEYFYSIGGIFMDLRIGYKIMCSNNKIYTIGEGNEVYTFSIIDESGFVVNLINDYHLEDCLLNHQDEICYLKVGTKQDGYPEHALAKFLIRN
jgi:hypothetical protein